MKMIQQRHRQAERAFSLVEVALALGLAGFCLVAVVGLLPVGFNANQSSVAQTTATSVAANVISDLRATPKKVVLSPRLGFDLSKNIVQTVYFDEWGNPTGAVNAGPVLSGVRPSRYRASIVVAPAGAGGEKMWPLWRGWWCDGPPPLTLIQASCLRSFAAMWLKRSRL